MGLTQLDNEICSRSEKMENSVSSTAENFYQIWLNIVLSAVADHPRNY